MSSLQKFRLATLAAALLTFGAASHAVLISSSSNNPFGFSWSQAGGTSGTLKGTGVLTITGWNSSALTINVTLNNTSTVVGDRLTSFGFGIDPNATAVSFSDLGDSTGMTNATLDSIPALKKIEICAWGGSNCSGGGGDGIFGGSNDSFSLILAGTWGTSVNIDPIGFKYQTAVGSYEFTTSSSGVTTSGKIPEPASTALVGLGLVALGAGFVRRRKQAAAA